MYTEFRLEVKTRRVMRATQLVEQYEELQYRNIGSFGPITPWQAAPKVSLYEGEGDE